MSFAATRVIERVDWSEGLFSLTLDAEVEPYAPGQFFNLAVAIEGVRVKRAYSVVSTKDRPPEFYIVAIPGGKVSPVLDRLRVGDSLELDPRPHGFFVATEVPEARDLWMVASGTGLGPYIAMLREGSVFLRHEAIVLVHSVRTSAHLGYRRELEDIADARPAFHYLPTLTREHGATHLHGRVDAIVANGELERAAGLPIDAAHSHVMVCGNPAMLDSVKKALEERGLKKHRRRDPGQLSTETYW